MRLILAAAAAMMPLLSSVPVQAAPQAAQRDWTKIVSRTPAGAFVMGNPNARVKLVEYLSFTCSHCAHFTEQAWQPLKANYVRKGLVSLEVRHAVRDGFDLAASLLARCEGPRGYFPASEAVFARQAEWAARAGEFAQATEDLDERPKNERVIAMAKGAGLDAIFAARGMSAPRIAACLTAAADQKTLAAMAAEAWGERKIGGTPSFLINGEMQSGVSTWSALEAKLKATLK